MMRRQLQIKRLRILHGLNPVQAALIAIHAYPERRA